MKSEKTVLEYLLEWIKNSPTWVKNLVTLIGLIAGVVVSFRNDKYLYTVIVIGLIYIYLLGVIIYILFKRDPSPFGGKGTYTYYKYRSVAQGFLIGLLISIVIILFSSQNRQYIGYAAWGTPTVAPSPTQDHTNKLFEVSSSWDKLCEHQVILLNDSDFPLIEKTYYDLGKGDMSKYWKLEDRYSPLNWTLRSTSQWTYSGLSLLLSGNSYLSSTVILKNEITVSVSSSPINNMTNILIPASGGCGGGAYADMFPPIHLFPGMNVLSKNDKFDYFSVAPSETLYFTFDFICESPGIYNLKFKIPYIYQDKHGEYEYLDNHSILCSKSYSVYEYLVDGTFQPRPSPPNSSIFSLEENPLPGDETLGKLSKIGEYHLNNKGEFVESLDWLPKDKTPSVPFWRMTIFNNKNFEGTPSYVGNIKIENFRLNTYLIEFLSSGFDEGIIPNNSYSILWEAKQHFFGGNYTVCVDDYNTYHYNTSEVDDIAGGTVQIDIDYQSVTPILDSNTSFVDSDANCVKDFNVPNGDHTITIKFIKDDSLTRDAHFIVHFVNLVSE